MKRILLFTLLLSFVTGCHRLHDGVSGSGKLLKQKRDIASFNSIAIEGAFNIQVVSQKPVSLEIEGDDNILPLITTEVSNNVLHIANLSGYSVKQPITLKIAVPDLEGISSSGAGTIEVSGVKNQKFEVHANGAPTIKVSGETNLVDIDTNGAAKIDTHKLRAARAVIDSKGVANVDVYARDQLDVSVSGPSQVTYEGNPVVKQNVFGPGSVTKKESSGS